MDYTHLFVSSTKTVFILLWTRGVRDSPVLIPVPVLRTIKVKFIYLLLFKCFTEAVLFTWSSVWWVHLPELFWTFFGLFALFVSFTLYSEIMMRLKLFTWILTCISLCWIKLLHLSPYLYFSLVFTSLTYCNSCCIILVILELYLL